MPQGTVLVLKSEELFLRTETVWKKIQHLLQLRSILLRMPLPDSDAGNGEAADVAHELLANLREILSTTASGAKQRYGIDWGWGM